MKQRGSILRWGGVGLGCALLTLFFLRGGRLLGELEKGRLRCVELLQERLFTRNQVVFLADFDEASPADRVSGMPLTFWNLDRVPGKFGQARRIDLEQGSVLQWPNVPLGFKGNEATFAAWFRPRDLKRRQVLLQQEGFSLELEDGELHLMVGEVEEPLHLACPYAGKAGKFCHVALVFERTHVAIYQKGEETVRLEFERPADISSLLSAFGVGVHRSFEGDLDELCIWKRVLTAQEVDAIARSGQGLRWKYEPIVSSMEVCLGWAESFVAGIYRTVGRLIPPRLDLVPGGRGFPRITLWPSKKDERHFTKTHEASMFSGYRTQKASEFREMDASWDEQIVRVEVALADVYGRGDGRRPAFVVKHPGRDGCGMVRLYPPELHEALHPDAPYPLPLSGQFVRLFAGDSYKGLYVMEDFGRTGSAWMARGERNTGFKRALYFLSVPADSDMPPPGKGAEEAYKETASLVLSDMMFPWSRQELSARRQWHVQRRAKGQFDSQPKIDALLRRVTAANLSPLFVTNDLALNVPGMVWETSDAELIASDGRVNRPAKGAPRPVMLTPVAVDGTRGEPMHFRVVPLAPDLQTLFLYIGEPVQKHRRSDFACLRVPAGGGAAEWLFGMGANHGGIKHRGNTSYLKGAKRSFSLAFDQPVGWPGIGNREARRVLLLSGYADATRLRNKLSFDSYRAAASDETPSGIVDVSWTEVFINGEYFGVWEMCRRVKDVCEPGTELFKVQALNSALWKAADSEMADYVSGGNPRVDPYKELERLFEFTGHSSQEQFAKRLDETFHVKSLIDYILMLNFTANFDGRMTNHYIGRCGGKWFIAPWDYDKTFANGKPEFLSNFLIRRLQNDVPGFQIGIKKEWQQLRNNELSDAAIFSRIDRDAAVLAPYMEEEFRLLPPLGDVDRNFPEAIERLKRVVADRLALMDGRYGGALAE